MQRLLNAMKLQAELAQRGSHARLGIVRGYDPNTYRAKVMIQPENQVTGWMPVATEWVGNGWGLFAPPAEGDAVLVEFFHGDFEAGVITRRLYHNAAQPLNVPIGEFWLVHQKGSALKFHNDGSVEIISNTDLKATVGGALTATVTGAMNANVTGKVTISSNAEVDLVVGSNATPYGIVNGNCTCAFTGAPHAMISATIKGSM